MPFEASTLVWTPTGAVPIFQLKVGDEVLAWNTRTSRISAREVTAVHKQMANHLRMFGDVRATDGQLFFVEGFGAKADVVYKALPIGDLAADDLARTVNGSESVGRTQRIPGEIEVWDIEVATLQTYLVGQRKLVVRDRT